jgi:cytochrome c peroxidase
VGSALAALAPVAARTDGGRAAFKLPRGLEDMAMPVPEGDAMTPGKIALGEQLFFDKRLSKTKAMSCETCHVPEKGWTDGLKLSPKFDGSLNTRHTPTLYGAGYYPDLYWDGRAAGLDAQILAAWKGQMGGDPDAVAAELAGVAAYKSAFEAELGGPPTGERVVKALAAFVRTIHAGDTPWDRMDPKARDASPAGRGFKVFSETARCTLCHLPPLYSDTLYHNVGIGFDTDKPDLGRGKFLTDAATKAGKPVPAEAEAAMGAFKTPSLRGAALSGPYFHTRGSGGPDAEGWHREPAPRREAEAGDAHGAAEDRPAGLPEEPDPGEQTLPAAEAAVAGTDRRRASRALRAPWAPTREKRVRDP